MSSSSPPSCTLYVNGVCEKVTKNSLKVSMHMLFSRCGKVTHIRTGVGKKGKGQVWVQYKDKHAAELALRDLQGFLFCGKPIKVAVAKKIESSSSSYTDR